MTSDIPDAFPLCPARKIGIRPMKSRGGERICNPLRNLSANPPRANISYGIAATGARPEKPFPTSFPTFPFRACSVPQGTISHLSLGRALHLTHSVHTAQAVNKGGLCGRRESALHRGNAGLFLVTKSA